MNRLSAPVATSSLLVADAACGQIQDLISASKAPVLALAAQAQGRVLGQISEGLRQQRKAGVPVRTLHLIAHGRPGAFRIGNVWIDAEALKAHATELVHWGVETIALWSCHVGADAGFVALLEELTGAQVLASTDWLGRDGDGNEQLQLGAWALSDLLESKTWPASFRLDVSIDKADGSGICAEDELLFKATGKDNGYVSITLALGAGALPAGSQVWFSATGEEGSWDPSFNSGDLTQLSATGEGYVKVKLPDSTTIGSELKAEIEQWDIQLDPGTGNPIIPLNYNRLELRKDNVEQLSGSQVKSAHEEWRHPDGRKDTFSGDGKYRYFNIFPKLSESLGYELIADVDFNFSGVRRFVFDDPKSIQGAEDERFQPLLQEGKKGDTTRGNAWADFNWTFRLKKGDQPESEWREVGLEYFFVNPIDVDSHPSIGGEFDAEYIQLLDSPDGLNIILPPGENNVGERNQNQKPVGWVNLLRDRGFGKYLGAQQFNAFNNNTANADNNLSNVPAASVLFEYLEPVSRLKFRYGIDGVINPTYTGNQYYKDSRFFSASFGNSITSGDGFKPIFESEKADGSIILEDCFDFYIKATAACENEETDSLTDASFTFEVSGGKENGSPQSLKGVYAYEITVDGERVGSEYAGYSYGFEDAEGNSIDGISYDPTTDDQDGKGTLTVVGDIEDFRVVFDVGSLALGDQLAGDESVTLKLTHEEKEKAYEATASLADELGCDSVESDQPSMFSITATAACENQETELLTDASFTFFVKGVNPDIAGNSLDSLKGSYTYQLTADGKNIGSEYAGYGYRFEDANGDLLGDKIVVNSKGVGSGSLEVNADVEEFRVVFDVRSLALGDSLVGDEELTLELKREDKEEFSKAATASLADDLGCDPVTSRPTGFTVEAVAACEKEDDSPSAASAANQAGQLLTDASFTFEVMGNIDPATRERQSLAGTYDYEIEVGGKKASAEFANYSYRIENENGDRIDEFVKVIPDGDGRGQLRIKEKDLDYFRVVFDVEASVAGQQLVGDESVTLELTRKDGAADGDTASLADDDLDCDPIESEKPTPQDFSLGAVAACVKDGLLSNRTAEFIFNVTFDPAIDEPKELLYSLTPDGLSDEDYAFNVQLSDGVTLKDGGTDGVLAVDGGVDSFSITITATVDDVLSGDETLALSLTDVGEVKSATASLAKLDCAPTPDELGKTDVALYLLMDNSTSMLQSDPSTALAGQANRLESQDRVSLYAYQQALEKAGYGFSRKGESGVLSTAAFKDAVIKNSAADLAEVLNDFEVIVDPNHSGNAQDLTLHLISYGYAVDYGSFTITADDPSAGKLAAEAIIGLQTPDQIYGNSIDDNTLWSERGLPAVTADDTFWGEGRPASNLYSGTEMLGALEGLEHLLAAQLNRGDADPITTYISMTTDGRPERRAWWDLRIGPGSDSLMGQPVSLPGSLGGDAITTSGLIYNLDGDATFLNNNDGEQQWTAMQNRLNATLDAIAAQQADPSNRLQVSVLGMGDGSDANFPAIYSDLFGLRTFNNTAGGWSYDYNTSYALPDFFG